LGGLSGLGQRSDRLAEIIQTDSEAALAQILGYSDRLVERFPGHEPFGNSPPWSFDHKRSNVWLLRNL
jgi:hypothetical protein